METKKTSEVSVSETVEKTKERFDTRNRINYSSDSHAARNRRVKRPNDNGTR